VVLKIKYVFVGLTVTADDHPPNPDETYSCRPRPIRQYFHQSRRSRTRSTLQIQISPADLPRMSRSSPQVQISPADGPHRPKSIFLSIPQIQSQIRPADPPHMSRSSAQVQISPADGPHRPKSIFLSIPQIQSQCY